MFSKSGSQAQRKKAGFFGLESQTKPDPMMPLRVLCNNAGTFAAQMAERRAIRRNTDPEFRKTADDAIVSFSKTASRNPLRPDPSSLQDQIFCVRM